MAFLELIFEATHKPYFKKEKKCMKQRRVGKCSVGNHHENSIGCFNKPSACKDSRVKMFIHVKKRILHNTFQQHGNGDQNSSKLLE
jgi:hypothetical protein